MEVFAQSGGADTALTLTLTADSHNKGVFYTSASDLAAAYTAAGIAEKDLPPEALVVKVDSDGDGSVGDNEPVVTTWLQPVVTSYDASADGLTITLNGNVADATPEMIQITAQTFEAGNMMPMETQLAAGSVTLTQDGSNYTVSASDLAAALQSAGAPNATALLVSVNDGDGEMYNAPSSVVWLQPVIVKYTAPVGGASGGATPTDGLTIQLNGDGW